MDLSFVIPTRDRPEELSSTLAELGQLPIEYLGEAEVVVIDNASSIPPSVSARLGNGLGVRVIRAETNLHTGARNTAAQEARGRWLVMLDDDSHPLPGPIESLLRSVDPSCAAVGGEIFLPDGSHEAGGLPEVIVGCGCAIRRDAFLQVGGYDARFGYYAEEYDLCAKLLLNGYRVFHTGSIRFLHRKVQRGRDFNEILFRLVRNNAWVIDRYAPAGLRGDALEGMLSRYERIAIKENAIVGYQRAICEIQKFEDPAERHEMPEQLWDRFTGLDAVINTLSHDRSRIDEHGLHLIGSELGKGRETIAQACKRLDIKVHSDSCSTTKDRLGLIATLSPGPMLDASLVEPEAIRAWELESIESSCIAPS